MASSGLVSGSRGFRVLKAGASSAVVRFVIKTRVGESLVIKSRPAASGVRRIAVPPWVSRLSRIITLMVTPVEGLVTDTLSPGRNNADLAYSPGGSSPSKATAALPSTEGFAVAAVEDQVTMRVTSNRDR
jgi:hypothetical protein